MKTKDKFSFKNDKKQSFVNSHNGDNDSQYSNLNLNQIHKRSILIPVQSSKAAKDNHYGLQVSDNDDNQFNKSAKLCSLALKLIDGVAKDKEESQKQWKKRGSSNSNDDSTLSLHISAYENSIEAVSNLFEGKNVELKRGNFNNQFFSGSTIQNPFEFPRQQKEDTITTPETTQFRASQRLINPNGPPSSSRRNDPAETDSPTDEPTTENPRLNRDAIGTLAKRMVTEKAIVLGSKGDRYQVEEMIDRGGFGTVFRVSSSKSNKSFAMKQLQSESLPEIEQEILKRVNGSFSIHFNTMIDYGSTNDGIDFVILNILGPNLATIVDKCSIRKKLKLADQCLSGIEALHMLGVLHLDIKANNFMLGYKGSSIEFVVHIIDFGLSRSIGDKNDGVYGSDIYCSIAAMIKGRQQGRKDDVEAWLYMVCEWMLKNLPWADDDFEEEERLKMKQNFRDDSTDLYTKFFGQLNAYKMNSEDHYFELAKIMRYLDNLNATDTPDYDRIRYFLQCQYQHKCKVALKEHKEQLKELSKRGDDRVLEKLRADYDQEEKEIANFSRHTGPVAEPSNLVFFSSIVYGEKHAKNPSGKRVKNIEYFGRILTKLHETSETMSFNCQYCIDKKPCGLIVHVFYNGTQRTWDEAKIKHIIGNPETCNKLKSIVEEKKLIVADELKEGSFLDSWKITSNSRIKGWFKVANIKFNDSKDFELKAIKCSQDQSKFEVELKILLLQKESNFKNLVQFINNGKGNGHSFFVIPALGPTLEQLRLGSSDKKFSLGTTYAVGLQCIDSLQQLHSLGFIITRVSPDVFSIGSTDPRRIVLFNYESCVQIVEKEKEENVESLFQPNNCCFSPNSKPESNIESLLYVMILCLNGSVPWENEKNRQVVAGLRLNMLVTGDQLPQEIRHLLVTVPFSPTLNYSSIKQKLLDGLKERQLSPEDPFDWQKSGPN